MTASIRHFHPEWTTDQIQREIVLRTRGNTE